MENLKQVVKDGREHGPFILMDSGGVPGNVSGCFQGLPMRS